MSHLNWIHASWQCDGCGKDFTVDIDCAWSPPSGWDTTKMAEDAVRHGYVVPSKGAGGLHGNSSSVQHDLVLCGQCTKIADSIGGEEHQAIRAEILSEIRGQSNK